MKRSRQLNFFKKVAKEYGGDLLKKRKGRAHGRPLDTKNSMHLVLRSKYAKGEWSFLTLKNSRRISAIIERFARKYGIKILSAANVGNHIHLHIQLTNRFTYKPFIRAITAAIAMAITGQSRWKKIDIKFWDRRPFTRVIIGFKGFLTLNNYIAINRAEGFGFTRNQARVIIEQGGSIFSSG